MILLFEVLPVILCTYSTNSRTRDVYIVERTHPADEVDLHNYVWIVSELLRAVCQAFSSVLFAH